ncbi:hypothetical protein [Rhodopseudomonas sp. B29]|uniref:hypothetical protein n=1 Tax=Rhodopseudomonas sp. B29 TaxID=95607 RepID=UPI0003468D18|nr:hypothetical protein [Rhodopseudomonas sp. B29]
MRLIIVALALLMAASAAHARGHRGSDANAQPNDAQKAKNKAAADKAYQDALKRIPDQNVKVDPWGTMR